MIITANLIECSGMLSADIMHGMLEGTLQLTLIYLIQGRGLFTLQFLRREQNDNYLQ